MATGARHFAGSLAGRPRLAPLRSRSRPWDGCKAWPQPPGVRRRPFAAVALGADARFLTGRSASSFGSSSHPSAAASLEGRGSSCGEGAAAARKAPPCALEALRAEVAGLRAAPPPWLLKVEGPIAAPAVVDARGDLVQPRSDEGPWDVHVTVAAGGQPLQASVYGDLRLRLRCGADWPRRPPVVRFCGQVEHHPLLDVHRRPAREFYSQLANRSPAEAFSLQEVASAAREFFFDPVEMLGLAGKNGEGDEPAAFRLKSAMRAATQVHAKRSAVIRKYAESVVHPELFSPSMPLRNSWLAPELVDALAAGTPEALLGVLDTVQIGEVYSVPLLTESFCDQLLEEVFAFYASGLPARRPNSMNNYGIILNDIGLAPFVQKLQALLQPLGKLLFPGPGTDWDGNHCFIVRYREGEDLGLDMHTDDSDVTFNICLGLEFAGAGLQFCGSAGKPDHRHHSLTYQHIKGRCLLHLGSKRHGADDIASGERINLILWNHSSDYRQSRAFREPTYHKEDGPPSSQCVSYTHDRDFGNFKPYPRGREHFRGRGWCPPPQAEYEGFQRERTAATSRSMHSSAHRAVVNF